MNSYDELAAFCNNITDLRKKHNLSQIQMAEIMGINVDCLIQIEQSHLPETVKIDAIFKLAAYFNCTYASLFSQK